MNKFIIFISLAFSFAGYAQSKLDSGLIAHYRLNNSVSDATKNKRDGKLIDGTYTSDRFGKANSALYFDGVDDYATILKFGKYIPGKDLTITLWAKSIRNVTSNTLMLMPDNANNRIQLSLYYSHNAQGAFFWDYAGISERVFIEPVSPSGSWEFFTVYYNSKTKKMGLYKNVSLIQEVSTSASYVQDSTKAMNIGMGKDGYYNGTLDDIRFYGRLLDTSEIRTLYNMPSAFIPKMSAADEIKIIPDSYNPGVFYVKSETLLRSVTIYEVSGKIIKHSDLKRIDLSNFASGIYYIRIMDSSGNIYTKKLLI